MTHVRLNGVDYPATANFNAVAAFLAFVGRNTMEGLMDISKLSPSDCPALVAACVNEGLRIDGKDERFTPEQIGAVPDSLTEVPIAIAEIFKELTPGASGQESKKKE